MPCLFSSRVDQGQTGASFCCFTHVYSVWNTITKFNILRSEWDLLECAIFTQFWTISEDLVVFSGRTNDSKRSSIQNALSLSFVAWSTTSSRGFWRFSSRATLRLVSSYNSYRTSSPIVSMSRSARYSWWSLRWCRRAWWSRRSCDFAINWLRCRRRTVAAPMQGSLSLPWCVYACYKEYPSGPTI